MARQQAKQKMMYYPTDAEHTHRIMQLIKINPSAKVNVLDPSCGEVDALRVIQEYIPNGKFTGIEMSAYRAEVSRDIMPEANIVCADMFSIESFSGLNKLVFMNPPYDDTSKVARKAGMAHTLQYSAVQDYIHHVQKGGVFVLVIYSHHLDNAMKTILKKYLDNITVINLGAHLEYNQIAIMGYKTAKKKPENLSLVADFPETVEFNDIDYPLYEINSGSKMPYSVVPYVNTLTQEQKYAEVDPVIQSDDVRRHLFSFSTDAVARSLSPAVKLNDSHMMSLLMYSLKGTMEVVDTDGRKMYIRLSSKPSGSMANYKTNEDEKKYKVTVNVDDRYALTVLYEDGKLECIEDDEKFQAFMAQHADIFRAALETKNPPVYDFNPEPKVWAILSALRIKGEYKLKLTQKHVAAAAVANLVKHKRCGIAAEPGFGKTPTAIAAIAALRGINSPDGSFQRREMVNNIVLTVVPPIMLEKWKSEINSLYPESLAKATIATNWPEFKEAYYTGLDDPDRLHFIVISETMMKNGSGWKQGYATIGGKKGWLQTPGDPIRVCPHCGTVAPRYLHSKKAKEIRKQDPGSEILDVTPVVLTAENIRSVRHSMEISKYVETPQFCDCGHALFQYTDSKPRRKNNPEPLLAVQSEQQAVRGPFTRQYKTDSHLSNPFFSPNFVDIVTSGEDYEAHLADYRQYKAIIPLPEMMKGFGMEVGVLMVDEVHQMKSAQSNRGSSYAKLAAMAEYLMVLSGTITDGKASNSYNLVRSVRPEILDGMSEGEFVEQFGKYQIEIMMDELPSQDSAVNIPIERDKATRGKETAGMRSGHLAVLLNSFIIANIDDLDHFSEPNPLPPFEEFPLVVEMDPVMKRFYEIQSTIYADASKSENGVTTPFALPLFTKLLAWLTNPRNSVYQEKPSHWKDVPPYKPEEHGTFEDYENKYYWTYRDFPRLHKQLMDRYQLSLDDYNYRVESYLASNQEVPEWLLEPIKPEPIPEGYLLPKESAIIELVKTELANGRRVSISSSYVNTGIHARIKELIEVHVPEAKIEVLNTETSNNTRKRAAIIKQWEDEGCNVLITNGALAAVGLDILMLGQTIIFYDMMSSYFTFVQFSKRGRRANQPLPCKVIYLAQKDTIEEQMLSSMNMKARAAAVLQGISAPRIFSSTPTGGSAVEIARLLHEGILKEDGEDDFVYQPAWWMFGRQHPEFEIPDLFERLGEGKSITESEWHPILRSLVTAPLKANQLGIPRSMVNHILKNNNPLEYVNSLNHAEIEAMIRQYREPEPQVVPSLTQGSSKKKVTRPPAIPEQNHSVEQLSLF